MGQTLVMLLAILFACLSPSGEVSPRIHVDQVGYLPAAAKYAIVAAPGEPAPFTLRRAADDRVAFRGRLAAARVDESTGDTVRLADFSAVQATGEYYLEVPGVGRSYPFRIAPDVYQRAFYLALRGFYGQRCGTAVDLGPEFPGYRHAICHTTGAWHPSSGRTGPRSSYHGWHDAGDYGRYIVNSGATVGTLLWAYELFGDRIARVDLRIPESGDAVPDILDEVHWNLDWMLTMQDSDGGVWQKQTVAWYTGFIMPEEEREPSVVIGTEAAPYKSSCATADFAASMAIAARAFAPYDRAFSGRTLDAARSAWTWVNAHPNVLFTHNPEHVGWGMYPDTSCADERLWAAAELWRTTGEVSYAEYFRAHYGELLPSLAAPAPEPWAALGPMALWSYALADRRGRDVRIVSDIVASTARAADDVTRRTLANAYRISLAPADFVWGSNGVAADYGFKLLVANRLHPDAAYVGAALENLHYLLGRNAFSLSWVTQVGSNPFRRPHHRPSAANPKAAPWPGLLSGGPNHNRQDPVLEKLPAGTPPGRMYVDDQDSYASNEIAINWQASLVFLLASAQPAPADVGPVPPGAATPRARARRP